MAKLIYLMGASGSGKDTLINHIKQTEISDKTSCFRSLLVAHRYITRAFENSNENHVMLTEAEFMYRKASGLFCMDWEANGLRYGIGQEVKSWIEKGHDVVVNGSRAYLPEAKSIFGPNLVAICLVVPEPILKKRLIERGRESIDEIDARLARAKHYADTLPAYTHFIENDSHIESALKKLYSLTKLIDSQTKGCRDALV
ncbi:ribose 1,5-bisphosphokinase [Thorsellia anophelis]|uniref:ribose 1,5-bisphosphate phosphokinase n=1 Tax=Thorsellia anophelis DSM 18579 TaxID=1123402 RepID=A0A1I0AR62_9GAMM|nr:ribose 1,5-bisphosphokinase [Thorsellia anophelis]SES96813.1 ribose 1,5-bisphosphokinase [Thorsellia anophelis DSM 18579]